MADRRVGDAVRRLTKGEGAIANADADGVVRRWQYGKRLLADPDLASNGRLRHGVSAAIAHASAAIGKPVSARELQYRTQAARTYRTQGELRNALRSFGSWYALTSAKFPRAEAPADPDRSVTGGVAGTAVGRAPDVPPGTGLTRQDPIPTTRVIDERGRPAPVQLAIDLPELDRPVSVDGRLTLAEFAAELSEREARTRRHADANSRSRHVLLRLVAAADGDTSVTVTDAADRLKAIAPTRPAINPPT